MATHKLFFLFLCFFIVQVDQRAARCNYGAFILSKFNMSVRESTIQNERHSSNSVNRPFLNRLPFSRSERVKNMGDEETKNLPKSCGENLLNAVSRLENRPQVSSSFICGTCGSSGRRTQKTVWLQTIEQQSCKQQHQL